LASGGFIHASEIIDGVDYAELQVAMTGEVYWIAADGEVSLTTLDAVKMPRARKVRPKKTKTKKRGKNRMAGTSSLPSEAIGDVSGNRYDWELRDPDEDETGVDKAIREYEDAQLELLDKAIREDDEFFDSIKPTSWDS
jgi:hypothetical protein